MNNIHKITYYDESMFRYVTEYRNNFGMLHREDGPALEFSDGDYEYYLNDKLHNSSGPARRIKNCDKIYYEYYFYGKKYSTIDEFYKKQYKGVKYKQKMRELKLNKMNNLKYSLLLKNIKTNDSKSIEKYWNDFVEVYNIKTQNYEILSFKDITIDNYFLFIKNEHFKILNIKEINVE